MLLSRQGILRPLVDNNTRWNSTYNMLNSLQKPNLKSFCEDLGVANKDFHLNTNIWEKIDEILTALTLAEKTTKKLQSEQLTFGDFYKI